MNRTRRRHGKARRAKARLKHEMQCWTKTNYTTYPKRGRLRLPVLRLAGVVDLWFRVGAVAMRDWLAPVMRFAGVKP